MCRLKPRHFVGFTVLSLVTLTAGCLERKESIRVARDGSVALELEFTGDLGDFDTGDAMPQREAGWSVQRNEKTDDQGKTEVRLLASLSTACGEPLPDSFAARGDRNRDAALSFPTEVSIEQRPDGTYYHFKRTYQARQYARYAFLQRELETARLKELSAKDSADLSDEERGEFVRALQRIEGLKRAEFAFAAIEQARVGWPQDVGLIAQRAIREHFEQGETPRLTQLLRQPNSEQRDRDIQQLSRELIEQTRPVLRAALERQKIPARQIAAFFDALDAVEARDAVTEDLADESWKIRLELPGELIAHNADELDEGQLLWEFDAKSLHDRDKLLMATSRVAR